MTEQGSDPSGSHTNGGDPNGSDPRGSEGDEFAWLYGDRPRPRPERSGSAVGPRPVPSRPAAPSRGVPPRAAAPRRDDPGPYGRPRALQQPPAQPATEHTRVLARPAPRRPAAGSPPGGRPPAGRAPAGRPPAAVPPSGPAAVAVPRRRRRHPVRRALIALLVLLLVLVGGGVGLGAYAWSKVGRIAAFPPVRTVDGPSTTYLLIGSDSRAGLSKATENALGTGSDAGARTDSILIVDIPSDGSTPAMISIPRDSYVTIPGHGKNKINAAFAFGGAKLLVRTIENDTKLHIDHVVEIGFGGFAGLVDDLGGVRICAKTAVKDADAHIDIPAGCQLMSGKTALGYVRARHFDPLGDLGRVQRQRQVVSAIVSTATSTSTLLHPKRAWDLISNGGTNVAVDTDMSSWDAVRLARAVRAVTAGHGVTTTVPIADSNAYTSAGSSVLWDTTKAAALFRALQAGHGVPASLVSRSGLAGTS